VAVRQDALHGALARSTAEPAAAHERFNRGVDLERIARSRIEESLDAPCDVGDLFRDLATLYSSEVSEGRLMLDAAASGAVVADPAQLRQALVNLIKNGLEAIDGDGRVTLAARRVDDGLEIIVADTGPGLSAEQRAHLFVPGFTTKASGSGLGLTIVERIVHDHGGTIVAEAAPEHGTLFRIHLSRKTRS